MKRQLLYTEIVVEYEVPRRRNNNREQNDHCHACFWRRSASSIDNQSCFDWSIECKSYAYSAFRQKGGHTTRGRPGWVTGVGFS